MKTTDRPRRTTDDDDWPQRPRRTTNHDDWPHRPRRLTNHEKRLTTTIDYDDQEEWPTTTTKTTDWPRRTTVQLLTYVDMSGWKVSIVLPTANAPWDVFAVKRCDCTHFLTHESMIVCSFEHNFSLVHPMRRVSIKLYQLRDATTCKFSLKTRLCTILTYAEVHVQTIDLRGHVWVESFHCFAQCERNTRCVHCKTTCVYITFRLTKTCICVTINISHYVFHLPSHRYTWILIAPRDFLTYKSFSISHY